MISGAGVGYLADRYSAKKLMVPIFVLSIIGLVMQGFADNLWCFGGGRVLSYLAAGGLPSVIQKCLASITPKEKRGTAFGLASTFNGIGILTATCLSSLTIVLTGCDGVFYTTAILFLLAMPLCIFCMNRTAEQISEEKQKEN